MQRAMLIDEYVQARIDFGDWSEDEEDMTPAQRYTHFRDYAATLTDDQLVSACNSYAMAE